MNTCTSCEYMLVLYAWSFNIFINNKYSEAISSIAVVVWNESDNVKCGILTWACHRPLIMIHGNCFKYKKKTKNLNVKKKSETLVFWTCFYIGCTGRICFFTVLPWFPWRKIVLNPSHQRSTVFVYNQWTMTCLSSNMPLSCTIWWK